MDGKFGYIDRRGEFVIPPHFREAGEFDAAGIADVELGDSWGVINRKGQFVVPAKFVSIRFIDRSGEFVIPPVYSQVSDFVDQQNGKESPSFSFRAPPGLAEAVSIDALGRRSTSYIDVYGNAVIRLPTGIRGVRVSRNGLFEVRDKRQGEDIVVGPEFGIFDPAKTNIPTTWFTGIGDFGDGDLVPVFFNSLWGYADRTGTLVIPLQFEKASAFAEDGIASVQVKGPASGDHSAAFIDRTGKVRVQTQFDQLSPFGASGFAQIVVTRPPGKLRIEIAASQCAARTP